LRKLPDVSLESSPHLAAPILPVQFGLAALLAALLLVTLLRASPLLAAESDRELEENPSTFHIHLPAVINVYPAIDFEHVWAQNENGEERNAFMPAETVQITAAGRNKANNELLVTLDWEVQDACGETFSGSEQVSLPAGEWDISQPFAGPDCKGIYSFSMQVEHLDQTTMHSSTFVVIDPSSLVFQDGQAFDKCNIASVSQMQTWWDLSPYIGTNLYIGGISRYCANAQLDASWIYQVSQQGWSFIPTWVGPQVPCSEYEYKMSGDPDVAYQQGRQEAEAANAALLELGFLGERIVYYDIEAYSGTSECRNAVNWFLKGWTERLNELGSQSGAYGATCRSYVSDWAEVIPPPEYVWLAYWVRKDGEFKYDPDASVWNLPCLSNELWADQQRIRQYAGDHDEIYGGVMFNIDSNVVESKITIFAEEELAVAPQPDGLTGGSNGQIFRVTDLGMLSVERGWLLVGRQLYLTQDGGKSWKQITPYLVAGEQMLGVFFLDENTAWLVTRDTTADNLRLYSSADGGDTWESSTLEVGSGMVDLVYTAQIQFSDPQHGWISFKIQSSRNFSLGTLLSTKDGGQSWVEYPQPIGGEVHFVDEQVGWLVGGPTGEESYISRDAGATWEAVEGIPSSAHSHGLLDRQLTENPGLANLPDYPILADFWDDAYGWAWLQSSQCRGEKVRSGETAVPGSEPFLCEVSGRLLKTKDGGQTWFEIDLGYIGGEITVD
ncbi:MAG: glycoside hydrolase domain-containing protein, partial [Anaerolineales bacterium]